MSTFSSKILKMWVSSLYENTGIATKKMRRIMSPHERSMCQTYSETKQPTQHGKEN